MWDVLIQGGNEMRVKFKRAILLFLCSVLGGVVLSGCSSLLAIDEVEAPKQAEIRVGVVLYTAEDPFVMKIYDSIIACAKQEQELSQTKIIVEVLDSEYDQNLQTTQIEQLIKEKYDAIAINLVDRAEASNIIDKVKNAKIPVVIFNREPVPQDMDKWDEVYYIGSHAAEAGEMQGEILLEAIQKGREIDKNRDGIIQYVMLEGEQGHQDSILRSYHSIKVLEEAGLRTESLAMDTAMWQRVQAKDKMLEWVEKFGNKIEVVLSNNDEMALGAITALEEKGYYDKKAIPVLGIDGLDQALHAIEEEKMLGTVLNNADEQGRAIFSKLYSLAANKPSQIVRDYESGDKYLWIPHQIITKETLK
ncbi:MAG: D-galactose-binding periplasmic protein precursor [Clostridia bacterium]|nr:D-galactose-binding periplasmic protein precursor [Clostridia bacterium]